MVDQGNIPALPFRHVRSRDGEGAVKSSPRQNTLVASAMLAGHGDAIGALVAALAVPLPPVAALAAHLTMPGAASLYDVVPAEGIPIAFTAFWTKVHAQQLLKRHTLVPTGQLVGCPQLLISEGLARFDVLDRADGQTFDIDPVQWILTVRAATVFVTRFVVLETVAPIGLAACFAVAVMFLFHTSTP